MRIAEICPPWIAVPPKGYGGIEWVVALLADWSDLRDALGLGKVPHPTTLFRARQRLAKKGASSACCARSSGTPGGRG